jgi:hypothetical protein
MLLMLAGCTRFADVVWRLESDGSTSTDMSKLEAIFLSSGYKRVVPPADRCEPRLISGRCEAAFYFPDSMIDITLNYRKNNQIDIRFVELPTGKFSALSVHLIKELSERLNAEFGPRLRLQYPREIPS